MREQARQQRTPLPPFFSSTHDVKCEEHVVRSTGKDLEVRETCGEGTSKSEIHLLFHAVDSEHVTGTADVTATMGGHTMHSQSKMSMKWLGACPPGKNE